MRARRHRLTIGVTTVAGDASALPKSPTAPGAAPSTGRTFRSDYPSPGADRA